MAGWICHTRKMLYSAIASLADDLEQTVQDFNDAIQRLNSSNVNETPRADQRDNVNGTHMADQRDNVNGTPRTDQRDKNERPESSEKPSDPQHSQDQQKGQNCPVPQLHHAALRQQCSAVQQQCSAAQQQYSAVQPQYSAVQQQYSAVQQQYSAVQQQYSAPQQQCSAAQQQYSAVQQQYSATTRQPETYRNLSAPSLVHSSPSLEVSNDHLPKLTELCHTVFQEPNHTSSSATSCTRCTLSLSSPCLTHSTESAHPESAHENKPPTISEGELASFNGCSRPRTVDPTVPPSRPPTHACPSHQKQSLQVIRKDFGFKRPGKVVRTHTLATEGQDPEVRQQPHSKEELPKAVVGVEKAGRCRQVLDRSGSGRSSLALKEKTQLLRWAGLRPLTSMLSFAVSQLSSFLHLLTDERVNCQALTSPRVILSTPAPGKKVMAIDTVLHQGQGQAKFTSMNDNTSHDIEESTLHGEEFTLHGEESTLHGGESTLHEEESTLHREESTLQGEESTLHREESTLHGEESTWNGEESTWNGEESTLHGEESTLHREESTLHGEESTLHGRTYSTESFVVIESPSCIRGPEEGRDGHGEISDLHRSLGPGRGDCVDPNGHFLTGWSDCGLSDDCGQVTEIVSSSVEWASFDVGKLVRDRPVSSWRSGSDISLGPGHAKQSGPGHAKQSGPGHAKQSGPGHAKHSGPGHAKQSGPGSLLWENGLNWVDHGKANTEGVAVTDPTKETEEEEEDCDSSVSIIALSDLDDSGEDGFIFF